MAFTTTYSAYSHNVWVDSFVIEANDATTMQEEFREYCAELRKRDKKKVETAREFNKRCLRKL